MELPVKDNVLIFSILMLAILITPLLSRLIKLPGVVGIIIAGILLGPNGLNILERTVAIEMLGTAGLLYIMFIAGVEINMSDFNRNKNKSIVFGILTFTIPQVAGTIIFLSLGYSWAASLLVASMFASHTLVGYPVIARLGLTHNKAVVTTVGGTILTDTAALLLLAIIARSVTGELNTEFWISLVVLTSIYFVSIIYLLPIIARWFFRVINDGISQFLFVLAIAFLCSYLARAIGIEPIIGAFLAGLVLNRLIPSSSTLMNRVNFIGHSLFIPFFLLYIGMIVDVGLLINSPATWFIMVVMLSTNVLTKLISSKITEKIFKFSKPEGWIIFGLSTTEAAATLAATLVGYSLGIIGDEVLNGVIFMIMITCIIGPWIVEQAGKKIVAENLNEQPEKQPKQNILVPISNPNTAEDLLSIAFMVKRSHETPVSTLSVVTDSVDIGDNVSKTDDFIVKINDVAAASNNTVNTLTRIDVNVANGIARAAMEERSDLLIIGWNGHITAQERIFGSILDQVLENTSQMILVCKIESPIGLNNRLVLDLPKEAVREPGFSNVLRVAIQLAKGINAPLLILTDEDYIDVIEQSIKRGKPPVDYTFVAIDGSKHMEQLSEILTPIDALFVVGARPKTMSWKPYADKLPNKLVVSHKNLNILIGYPNVPYNKEMLVVPLTQLEK